MTAQSVDLANVFSVEGKGIKLDTAEAVAEYVKHLQGMATVEEIRLSGSSYGIEATRAIADALKTKTTIKVRRSIPSSIHSSRSCT